MLSGAVLELAARGWDVTVMARKELHLRALASKHENICFLALDYSLNDQFDQHLGSWVKQHGLPGTVIAWIHGDPAPVIAALARHFNQPWTLIHVVGSRTDAKAVQHSCAPGNSCIYRQVQLGFKIENGISRWLTNREISNATIQCIDDNADVLAGQIDPWELRPGGN